MSASSYPGWRFCRVDPHKIVGRRSATGLVALLRARGESWRASSQATLSPFHGLEVGAGTSSLSNWPCRPFTGWRYSAGASSQATLSPFYGLEVDAGT